MPATPYMHLASVANSMCWAQKRDARYYHVCKHVIVARNLNQHRARVESLLCGTGSSWYRSVAYANLSDLFRYHSATVPDHFLWYRTVLVRCLGQTLSFEQNCIPEEIRPF